MEKVFLHFTKNQEACGIGGESDIKARVIGIKTKNEKFW